MQHIACRQAGCPPRQQHLPPLSRSSHLSHAALCPENRPVRNSYADSTAVAWPAHVASRLIGKVTLDGGGVSKLQ